jgi:hypothetical protein
MVQNRGRFKAGHLNVRRKDLTVRRHKAAARDARRRTGARARRAAGTLASLCAAAAAPAALTPLEQYRTGHLYAALGNQASVAAMLGRSQSAVSRALAEPRVNTPAALGRPRALPVDSSERACLRALMLEDPGATAFELMFRLRDMHCVELSVRTVSRERERFTAEDATFKERATNRYAHFTETLLDMHMGFHEGLRRATDGAFFDLVYQASPFQAQRRTCAAQRARRPHCALTAPRASWTSRPRSG